MRPDAHKQQKSRQYQRKQGRGGAAGRGGAVPRPAAQGGAVDQPADSRDNDEDVDEDDDEDDDNGADDARTQQGNEGPLPQSSSKRGGGRGGAAFQRRQIASNAYRYRDDTESNDTIDASAVLARDTKELLERLQTPAAPLYSASVAQEPRVDYVSMQQQELEDEQLYLATFDIDLGQLGRSIERAALAERLFLDPTTVKKLRLSAAIAPVVNKLVSASAPAQRTSTPAIVASSAGRQASTPAVVPASAQSQPASAATIIATPPPAKPTQTAPAAAPAESDLEAMLDDLIG